MRRNAVTTTVAVIVSLALFASRTGCHLKYSGFSQRRCSPHEEVLWAIKEGKIYLLNRHAQIVEDSKIALKVTLRTQESNDATMQISIKRALIDHTGAIGNTPPWQLTT